MQEFDEDKELERIKKAKEEMSTSIPKTQPISENNIIVSDERSNYELQVESNKLVGALVDNDTAISIAKDKYKDLKNQKQIAQKMGKVVNKKTNTDIETADLKVEQQRLANTVERARQKNELVKCRAERKLIQKESRHNLQMQKFRHRKEKYGDLLLRHCRKKIKNNDGEWEFQYDKEGNPLVNMPNAFVLFFLIVFDSLVMFFNQIADILGSMNKVAVRAVGITIILIVVLVQPIRDWLIGLIGIHLG